LKYVLSCDAPIAQLAEAADLKSAKCRFESDWGHGICSGKGLDALATRRRHPFRWASVSVGRNFQLTRIAPDSNQTVNPPSTFQVMPVMNAASGLTK
jgi:hypothetical protein